MRNICRLIELCDKLPQDVGNYTLFTVDSINNIVYTITDTNVFIAYDTSLKKVNVKIELNQQDILSEGAKINAIQFIPDLESICMASDLGDILMYSTMTHQLECVGIVGSGILCMSWSPDYELLILATETQTLVQMNKDWDILGEVNIHSLLAGGKLTANIITNSTLPQSIYSQSAYAPETMAAPAGAPQANRYRETPPSISWRGDGQYFVCSSFDPAVGKVMLRTWERSLVLHAISEPLITGLESVVAWRPSGSLVACPNRLPNKHEIALFERNGLKHGEFNIRVGAEVLALEWSADSEILALHLRLTNSTAAADDKQQQQRSSVVQIWHRSNYHWFLKHELHCAENDSVVCIRFDNASQASILRVLTKLGELHEHLFAWDYNASLGDAITNPATVAMVDGQHLKMTPFRKLVIPPPMSHYQHQLDANCSAFDFSQTDYSVVTLQVNNSIAIFKGDSAGLLAKSLISTATLRLDNLRHLCWVSSSNANLYTLVAVDGLSTAKDQIVEIGFKVDLAQSSIAIQHIHRTNAPESSSSQNNNSRIIRLIKHLDHQDQVLFETNDGAVYYYHLQAGVEHSDSITPYLQEDSSGIFKFPSVCTWFAVTKIAGEEVLIGLNDRNKLYVNQTVLASDCNSFALHNKFLLYTTVSHVLRSIPLSVPLNTTTLASTPSNTTNLNNNNNQQQQQQQPNGKGHHHHHKAVTTYDDSTREVERGSRIAVVVPHDTRVVLQMPRGNLEAISPRSLTLSTIRELLNEHQYGKAFSTMRRNRIDMNFLYDHNPADFLKHIDMFVEQIPQIDYLNLFITSLRDQDTSKTLFVDLENPVAPPPKSAIKSVNETYGDTPGKVNLVCDKLREVFVKIDQNRFIQPVLTTYVKKSPPELDEALRLIQNLRGLEEVSEHGETIVNRLAEESLDYIVFLVDVNKLYDVALGTYDFDLVLMVAQKSQKDPKEYIAFLRELQSMEINYQRFTIDKHLERWPKALANLALAGDEHLQECYDLTVEKSLYHDAIKVFAKRPELKVVQELYADHLMQNNRFEEAAFLYFSAENHKKALASFKDAGKWKLALKEAKKLNYSAEDTKTLCEELAEHMRRASKFLDSAIIFSQHCGDIENALRSHCEGGLWEDAYDLAVDSNRKDLVDSIVAEQLLESYNNHMKEIEENHATYNKSYVRLGVVRTTKLNHVPLRLMPGAAGFNDETSSMMSGMSGMFSEQSMGSMNSMNSASTTSSYRSTYSSATGTFSQATKIRNKKKDQSKRKVNKVRVTGKEGSVHEEEFIVEAMKKMIPGQSQQEVVANLLRGLVLLGWSDKAEQLQNRFKQYLELIKQSLDLLSQSATAVLPENVREEQRVQELEYQRLISLQQQDDNNTNNNNNNNNQQNSNHQNSTFEKMTINKVTITMDTIKWELNIF
ncbi:elongation protein 1 [Heterostelium album PN500]|uniref:Elongator complex protein 1 n=1 Tax=Heterostelium pallidum (strain ATCC 26659 / Pp 5 / PN500) TaxID=670386 RepID=D3B268_HETP5|nr:elongation protein 1 [Heterostelium album PN500]EFA84443.1 elongation protein 1 [Heterostelium album PN500]|eukprot:XP_020436557.1 elongation protein 1 [Heterostelium album PN500]